jgi:micrococcal nuclease
MRTQVILLIILLLALTACEEVTNTGANISDQSVTAQVVRITDGDTIKVDFQGTQYNVRYIGINTPEIAHNADQTDDACGRESTEANRRLVEGQTVRLERDVSDVDQYGRLLRYIYVGDTFVNEVLVRDGWAEAARYAPDTREFENFRALEEDAANAGVGCHLTGIFDDGNDER